VAGPAAAEYPGALTIAAEIHDGNSELAIVAMLQGRAEASIGLYFATSYPESGEVTVNNASGNVSIVGGASIAIEGGTGTITVTHRTPTHIMGSFSALLRGSVSTDSGTSNVEFAISGSFESGAPVGDLQALRGSPIPADLFETP
jgi:hypothetical protein